MKICITGSFGYVGSILTKNLLDSDKVTEIIAIDNLMYRQTSPLFCPSKKLKFYCNDVRDYDFIKKVIDHSDIIIPLAALVGMPACNLDPILAKAVNQDHVQFICKNLKKNQRIYFFNTNSAYGATSGNEFCTEETPIHPISLYASTKCEAEKSVIEVGGTSLRLATVFGISPKMRLDLLVNNLTFEAKKNKFLVLFESHFKRNYIHVKDVSNALEMIMFKKEKETRGQIYNLGLSDANLSKIELSEKIKKYVPELNIFTAEYAKDLDQRNYLVSNDKIEKLGFKAKYSLDDGIQELLQFYPVFERIINKDFTNL